MVDSQCHGLECRCNECSVQCVCAADDGAAAPDEAILVQCDPDVAVYDAEFASACATCVVAAKYECHAMGNPES
jgi:1,4-dihydroxy-2-naphthoyl-CoA synthase